ncbi:MAG: Uma2 family endonuclease [Deltaproteobacteria bacterium]|nr:Uma2 family endonuclease [Deltaproteobacteria bacterium]MDQ3297434.1 Uma2 family endonuclease [Myxococcota bacterium]
MLPSDVTGSGFRPLKRVEYERLGVEGFFDNERVELLFGVVVEMPPVDPAHGTSIYRVRRKIEASLGDRAMVRDQNSFAASDISEPQPDIMVVPNDDYWKQHPSRAYLVVEVSRSSLDRDQGVKAKLYGLAEVDEYWIVNHVDEVVEVYRDRKRGKWRSKTTHHRGETIAMLTFPDVTLAVSEILPPVDA